MIKKIFGHVKEIQLLQKLDITKLPSSLILSGEKGIGKFLLAEEFSKYWLTNKTDQLKDNFLNNIFTLNSTEIDRLNIQGVRNLIREMSLSSINDLEKFFIIDDFDSLNINSKNALLKNLEEPPENSKIILISHKYETLLKTIKSRCININLTSLSNDDFEKFLINKEPDINKEEKEKLIYLCNGRPGLYDVIRKTNWLVVSKKINKIISYEEINYEKIFEIFDVYKKETIYLDFLIKKQLYDLSMQKLLKNKSQLELYKNIVKFINFISQEVETNININLKNYFLSIFISYFKLVKKFR